MGDAGEIDRVVVRWPGGKVETFTGLKFNQFLKLVEGKGIAAPFKLPTKAAPLAATTPAPAKPSSAARIVEPGRPPAPHVFYLDPDGQEQSLAQYAGQPLLVTLWASWCSPCMKELQALSARAAEVQTAGLNVLALNVEQLDPQAAGKKSHFDALTKMKYPFLAGTATKDLVQTFDLLQRGLINKSQPLPLPASFLIDGQQRVVVVYLGPVEVDQLLRDVQLLQGTSDELRSAGAARPGRWITHPYSHRPVVRAILRRFIEAGLLAQAGKYIEQTGTRDANVTAQLAKAHADGGDFAAAAAWQRKALDEATAIQEPALRAQLHKYEAGQRN